jgi:capsular polysaccharide transport system permease protein
MMIHTNAPGKDRPQPVEASYRPNRTFPTLRTITALILREMTTRYGRNPGGYIWAIAEPLGAIIILSVAFSLLLRAPSLGTSFILFYSTGYLAFNIYQNLATTMARAIEFSRPLLMYPVVKWIDALLARFILNFLTALLVGYILLTGIIIWTETRLVLDMPALMRTIGMAACLGFGIGILNCALIGLYPTWAIIWSILTRPLFIMSGVIYVYEDLPRFAQNILWYNPLIHITAEARVAFYPTYSPNFISEVYVMTWAFVSATIGLILLTRFHRDILNRRF